MSFAQVYYTSAQVGLRSGKGFQINAATPGIDPTVLQQVQRLGLYVPPTSAPSRPSADEIENFPLSLLFVRLPDGTAILGQAKYIGIDYSGRYGNYFSHSLVTNEADLVRQKVLPIELWRSAMWETRESAVTSLPAQSSLAPGMAISREVVQSFLLDARRREILPAFLTAVEQALTSKRRIVIVDQGDATAMWIAVASYLLPEPIVFQMTFNTYVKNVESSEGLIVGTTSDSDFKFTPLEIEHKYFVFDFIGGRTTTISQVSPFAEKIVATLNADSAPLVLHFGEFAGDIIPPPDVAELASIFDAFALSQGIEVSNADPIAVLKWCEKRLADLNPEFYAGIFDIVIRGGVTPHVVDACAEFYSATKRERDGAVRRAIEPRFLDWLLTEVLPFFPVALLSQRIRGIVAASSRSVVDADAKRTWREQLLRMDETPRLAAALLLGEIFQVDRADAADLRDLGEQIGRAVSEPVVRDALVQLARGGAANPLLEGVGLYLSSVCSDTALFTRLTPFLGDQGIWNVMCEVARNQRALPFYLQLLRTVPCNRDRKVEAFCSSLAFLRDLAEGSPQVVDQVYDAIWPLGPDLAEAAGLIDKVPIEALGSTNIPRRIFELLQANANSSQSLRTPRLVSRLRPLVAPVVRVPESRPLQGTTSATSLGRTEGAARPTIKPQLATDTMAANSLANESDPVLTLILKANQETSPDAWQAGLRDAAKQLLGDLKRYQNAYHHVHSLRKGIMLSLEFRKIYLDVVSQSLSSAPVVSTVALLFWVGCLLSRESEDAEGLDPILSSVVGQLSAADLNSIAQRLTDEKIKAAFLNFRQQHAPNASQRKGPKKGIFARLSFWKS